ncbi:MAG: TetR/AcrR family transcriptional regulator [Nitrospirota bacterium]|nr:TetR/AcrR family transcriptional regulator [Nitrospirota bacterium]
MPVKTKGRSSRKSANVAGERRREAIMEAAWGLFKEKGYAAVSVDEIIRKSGGSKTTLYEIFGSKEGLFHEIVNSVTSVILKETEMPVDPDHTPREALTRIGNSIATQILTVKGIDLYILAVSVSKRFPDISRMFFESGPEHGFHGLAQYLKREVDAGRLRIKDPQMAAEFFFGMIVAREHIAMPVGCAAPPSKARIRKIVDEAVNVFLAAYSAEK